MLFPFLIRTFHRANNGINLLRASSSQHLYLSNIFRGFPALASFSLHNSGMSGAIFIKFYILDEEV
jgi:hypothetical protein